MSNLERYIALGAVILGILGLLQLGRSRAGEIELDPNPDSVREDYYRTYSKELQSLIDLVTDRKMSTQDRLRSFDEIRLRFRDAAVTVSMRLLKDESEEVAKTAAGLLASSIVMTDHRQFHGDTAHLTEEQRYLIKRHNVAREALRATLKDNRQSVRSIAAQALSSLSDEPGLDILESAAREGIYTDYEAVNYLGLADPDIAGDRIRVYLDRGSKNAQVAAVGYLAASTEYQSYVRERILLNRSISEDVRMEAAKVLGQYDQAFPTYALSLIRDMTQPEKVYTQILTSSFLRLEAEGKLDAVNTETYRKALQDYKTKHPNAEFGSIEARLDP